MIEALLFGKLMELHAKSKQIEVRLEQLHGVLCELVAREVAGASEQETTAGATPRAEVSGSGE